MTGIIREEQIGPHRLILGDCREVLPGLGKVDAVVTDPPFSVSVAGSKSKGPKGTRRLNFFDGDDDWAAMTATVADAVHGAISLSPRNVVVWCGHRQIGAIVAALEGAGYATRPLCWKKTCPPPSAPGSGFTSAFEMAVYGFIAGRQWNGGQYEHNIFEADSYRFGQPGKVAHPTQKPLSLIEWNVHLLSDEGDRVLDCFMGSGTTLVACQRLGRVGIGIEIDPGYFDIACRRVEAEMRQPRFDLPQPVQAKQETLL